MAARSLTRIGAGLGVIALIGGCTTSTTTRSAEVAEPAVTACQISDERGLLDNGLNASVSAGLDEAEQTLNAAVVQVESGTPDDYPADLASLRAQNCGITFGVGVGLKEALAAEVASAPGNFVLVDDAFTTEAGGLAQLDNAKSVQFDGAQAGYLAGYAAAGVSKSGVVAVIAASQAPQISAALDGFVDGVAGYNAANQTAVTVLGWDKATQQGAYAATAVDAVRGRAMAQVVLDQGADVVTPIGGPFGLGVLDAVAAKEGTSAVWYGGPIRALPRHRDVVAAAVVLNAQPVVLESISQTAEAEFNAEPYLGTVQNEGITLVSDTPQVSEAERDLATQLEDVRSRLADGSLVPQTTSGPVGGTEAAGGQPPAQPPAEEPAETDPQPDAQPDGETDGQPEADTDAGQDAADPAPATEESPAPTETP